MTAHSGFDNIKEHTSRIVAVLRDIALLIDSKPDDAATVCLETDGESVVPGLNMTTEATELRSLAEDLDEGLFTLMVAGKFKNGKSTLLNAMLGDKALPASVAPTTGVITMLVYGESDLIQVFKYDRSEPEVLTREAFFEEYRLKTEDATSITDELQQYRFQNVKYARLECRHPICAKGVRLVDSPGLGEHTSRSELTTSFLKQSQAVIFVLNAIVLFDTEESNFIYEHLGEDRLNHVFFPVNRVNQVEEVDELHQRARTILKRHFLDESGEFDQAHYDSRVFWLNAHGALSARQNVPPDEEKLITSGILDFEQELENFLTDEEMFQAMLASSSQLVQQVVKTALRFVNAQKTALREPVAELKIRRKSVNAELDELELRIADIETMIQQRGEKVQFQLEVSLHEFLDQLQAGFSHDVNELVETEKIKKISIGTIALSGLKSSDKKKIAEAVRSVIAKYMEEKFSEWSEQATELAKVEVEDLHKQLDSRIERFTLRLSQARNEFFGNDEKDIVEQQNDISISVSSRMLLGGQGFWGIIGGSIRRLFIIFAVLSLSTLTLFGWILLIGSVLAEFGIIIKDPTQFKKTLIERVFTAMIDSVREDLNNENFTQYNIHSTFATALREQKRPLDKYLWAQLGQDTQNLLNDLKRDRQSNIDEEKFEEIRPKLVERLNLTIQAPLYDLERFEGITLADETIRIWKQDKETELPQLNRNLLTDAYPDKIVLKLKDSLSRSVRTEFIRVANQITGKLTEQPEQLRSQMDGIIAELEKEEDSANRELARLDEVSVKLVELFNIISVTANNRTLTMEELLDINAEIETGEAI